ncbi:MAG: ATP-binding protein [Candidatus Aminicenantes bacterium]|nr:ATP-binding protein [Candidatus Aminicenantes bacterium]
MSKLKKQQKKNGILEFFGVERPFFITKELKGREIDRFVDRQDEIRDLRIALELKQNFAVIGDTGTGKSSLLHKFMQEISGDYFTDYLYFSMDAKTEKEMKLEFFRRILTRLLLLIIENDELLDAYNAEEINTEIERLNFSITSEDYKKEDMEISPEIEANFPKIFTKSILPLDLNAKLQGKIGKEKSKSVSKSYIPHTEDTLRESIEKITGQLPGTVVLFIDEMDRIIKAVTGSQNWLAEVIKILQFSTEIMTHENLVFFFALQPEIYDIFDKARRGEGDDSILKYVSSFRRIGGFDRDFAGAAAAKSLKFAGYKGKAEDLIAPEVMDAVLTGVNHNPRQFMLKLLELLKLAYKKSERKVTMAILQEYLRKEFGDDMPERWRGLVQ